MAEAAMEELAVAASVAVMAENIPQLQQQHVAYEQPHYPAAAVCICSSNAHCSCSSRMTQLSCQHHAAAAAVCAASAVEYITQLQQQHSAAEVVSAAALFLRISKHLLPLRV